MFTRGQSVITYLVVFLFYVDNYKAKKYRKIPEHDNDKQWQDKERNYNDTMKKLKVTSWYSSHSIEWARDIHNEQNMNISITSI